MLEAFITRILIGLIRFYKQAISPFLPQACRFMPTCSCYAVEAIQRHGPAKGLLLAISRLLKCQPLHSGGYDPVK
ncbi:MAG: membrane protein insertion efficiency factor YidD [Nitrospirae bacterium]|nr:membrane protein insertion efficiency factor YidD [Nitrospirota bacterium]